MFQIDIGIGVASHSELRVQISQGVCLADDVAQAYEHITFSIHIYLYTFKKHRFCANLVTHTAGSWGTILKPRGAATEHRLNF
jgi:hypothetical protein